MGWLLRYSQAFFLGDAFLNLTRIVSLFHSFVRSFIRSFRQRSTLTWKAEKECTQRTGKICTEWTHQNLTNMTYDVIRTVWPGTRERPLLVIKDLEIDNLFNEWIIYTGTQKENMRTRNLGVRASNAPGAPDFDSIRYTECPETSVLTLAASFSLSLIVAFKAPVTLFHFLVSHVTTAAGYMWNKTLKKSKIISVFYFTRNRSWNWNYFFSRWRSSKIILKLFQRQWTCRKTFVSCHEPVK